MDKSSGRARYTADIQRPGMLHAVLVRSRIARGTAVVDMTAARAFPGVLDTLTAADVAGTLGGPAARLFDTRISYVGQPLAAICAESLDAAWSMPGRWMSAV